MMADDKDEDVLNPDAVDGALEETDWDEEEQKADKLFGDTDEEDTL